MRRTTAEPPELAGLSFERPLGAGGFADVFLYQQELPRRRVAVKVLLTEGLTAASRAAFVAEANLMAQLSAHPYIVTIYHADVSADGRPYIVMEYCSGPSLAERYKRERFDVADALRTGIRLAGAVATAHHSGILHRDIKPANVLTNDFGWPALTDFGIASALEDDLPVHTTTSPREVEQTATTGGSQVGMSVPWSPPEMFGDDPDPDVRSDVFSLAATIHTLLAGRTPFEIPGRSNGTLDLIGRIERGMITPIERADLPRSLVAVLQKGMAVDRADRFATAVELGRALQRVELELGYAPTNIEVPTPVAQQITRDDAAQGEETRVRQVATIDAQAVAAAETQVRRVATVVPTAQPPAEAPAALDRTVVRRPVAVPEATVLRSRTNVEAEEAPLAEPEAVAAPRSRRGLVLGLVGGIGLLAAAAIVVTAVVLGGTATQDDAAPTPDPTHGGSAIVDTVPPAPVDGAATPTADGTGVVFSFRNPEPQDGDAFRWNRSEDPDQSQPLAEGAVTVPRQDGERVCVDVVVSRAGRLSDPLKICYPDA